ncbi:MAG: AAA family ATPase [Anaerolineales bacterium]
MIEDPLVRLEEGLAYRLTLLLGPAGSGKTTLLRRWAASVRVPVAWLSLTAVDNDPEIWLNRVAEALSPLAPLPLLLPEAGEERLVALLNILVDLHRPVAFVLDDYHHVTSPQVHALLASGITYLPPAMHLYLAARRSPPLPLALWRVRRQLLEIAVG